MYHLKLKFEGCTGTGRRYKNTPCSLNNLIKITFLIFSHTLVLPSLLSTSFSSFFFFFPPSYCCGKQGALLQAMALLAWMMPTMTPKIPNADAKISTTKIFTNRLPSCASAVGDIVVVVLPLSQTVRRSSTPPRTNQRSNPEIHNINNK